MEYTIDEDGDICLTVKAKWLVNQAKHNKDYACAECVPFSDVLITGFKCVFHKAEQALTGVSDG